MSREYEKIREQVRKKYAKELEAAADLKDKVEKIESENAKLRERNDVLEQENAQLKDWVERMQEYCNLSDEDMQLLHDNLQAKSLAKDVFTGVSKEERAKMTADELLRVVWLLDECIDLWGWHFVSKDGFPKPNKHGYWCKMADGRYDCLFYDEGFFYWHGSIKIYISDDNLVRAWQRLTEIAVNW